MSENNEQWIDELISIIYDMEIEVYDDMKRLAKRHMAEEIAEGARWTQWQAIELGGLSDYRRELSSIIDKTFDVIDDTVDDAIAEAYHDAADGWAEDMVERYQAAGKEIPWEGLPVYHPSEAVKASKSFIEYVFDDEKALEEAIEPRTSEWEEPDQGIDQTEDPYSIEPEEMPEPAAKRGKVVAIKLEGFEDIEPDEPPEGDVETGEMDIKTMDVDDDTFFAIDKQRIEIVMKDVHRDMDRARYAAIERAGAQYVDIMRKADIYRSTGVDDLYKGIERATTEVAATGLDCVEYQLGKGRVRRVNVASYIEMALRTSTMRARHAAEGARRDMTGEYKVVSPALHTTCEHCYKWQAVVMIDDVFANGGGTREEGDETPYLSEAVADKFLHPNCRHILTTHIDGLDDVPKQSPQDKTKKQYEAEQEQRRIERKIRKAKREAAAAMSAETAAEAAKDVKAAQAEMREHLEKHPHLIRIPQRERLLI